MRRFILRKQAQTHRACLSSSSHGSNCGAPYRNDQNVVRHINSYQHIKSIASRPRFAEYVISTLKIHENPVNLTIYSYYCLTHTTLSYILYIYISCDYIHLHSYIYIYSYYIYIYIYIHDIFLCHFLELMGGPANFCSCTTRPFSSAASGRDQRRPATTSDDPERRRRCGAPRSEGRGSRGATTRKNGWEKYGFI